LSNDDGSWTSESSISTVEIRGVATSIVPTAVGSSSTLRRLRMKNADRASKVWLPPCVDACVTADAPPAEFDAVVACCCHY